MSTVSDSWHPLASTSTSAAVASPSTPSKRASRSSRVSNDTDYAAFTRTVTDPASGFDNATEFRIGDAVVVGADAKLKQKFLGAPLYQLEQKKKGKGKKKQEQQQQPYEGWRHEDGLEGGDKVAVITRLFEDVRGRKMALVRWFARPGAVWGPDGPEGDDEVEEVLPYELYYTADSTHLAESRALRSRAAANPFSSPSASPFKSSLARSPSKAYAARASNPLSAPSHLLSAAASFRTPQHSDPIPLSTITSHAEIFSPAALSASGIEQLSAAQQRPLKTFVCRRVYDVKPVHGAGFWSDLEWEELRQRGVEGYEEAMAEGGAAKAEAMDGWDVEARMEESEEEEESEEQIRKRQATLEKRKRDDRGEEEGAGAKGRCRRRKRK
ncbi:Origin recognition complex, subunit 1 [Rhodosporidiobolus nylandii]